MVGIEVQCNPMPTIQVLVNDQQRNDLQRNARQSGMTQAEFIRCWLDSLGTSQQPQVPADWASLDARLTKLEESMQPLPIQQEAKPPAQVEPDQLLEQKKVKALAELQQWQSQPPAVEPEPVAIEPAPIAKPSAFSQQLRAKAAEAAAES